MLKRTTLANLFLISAAALLFAGQANADDDPCGRWDPDCRRHIKEVFLQTPDILAPELEAGVRFGGSGVDVAIRFGFDVLSMQQEYGDLDVLSFEALYVPDEGGFRVTFSLAESQVSYFCKGVSDGKIHAPQNLAVVGGMAGFGISGKAPQLEDCEPATWGIGGTVGRIQYDTDIKRFAARWIELNAVVNFLRNGNTTDYLSHRLEAFGGFSVDSVWPGDTPGADGSMHALRLNLGITGMIRSADNRWEFRGMAAYRPDVTDWTDWTVEVKATALYNILFGDKMMGSVGLSAGYEYWSNPAASVSPTASATDSHNGTIMAIFRMNWGL